VNPAFADASRQPGTQHPSDSSAQAPAASPGSATVTHLRPSQVPIAHSSVAKASQPAASAARSAIFAPITPTMPVRAGGGIRRLQGYGGSSCPAGTCDHKETQSTLARAMAMTLKPSQVPSTVYETLQTPDQPLETRGGIARRSGHDFRPVRVHSDARAANAVAVSDPADPSEVEAERIADEVMRAGGGPAPMAGASAPALARAVHSPARPDGAVVPPAGLESGLAAARSSAGNSLPEPVLGLMEARFGWSFGAVRVHDDDTAHQLSRSVGAFAATTGSDIFFAAGQYRPDSPAGQRLLAHELTHVIQQQGPAAPATQLAPTGTDASAIRQSLPHHAVIQRESSLVQRASERVTSRAPNDEERSNARLVFGSSLNLDGVMITESAVMSSGFGTGNTYARTLPKTVYVWPGELDEPTHLKLMMHEFTHLWQYQHGVSVGLTAYYALLGNYNFGDLREARKNGKKFFSFNTEQQGDICQAYWVALTSGADTSAFDPYIAQVRNGGYDPIVVAPDAPPPNLDNVGEIKGQKPATR